MQLAEEELEVTMAALRAKQAELKAVEDGLAALQGQYNDAVRKKGDLESSVENTNKKLDRATTVRPRRRRAFARTADSRVVFTEAAGT